MQHLNERNVFTKTITIIQIMNEMCTWTNLVHRTNIGISPLMRNCNFIVSKIAKVAKKNVIAIMFNAL